MSENPNTNCLQGMKCPRCGRYGPFLIKATTSWRVTDEGAEIAPDCDWGEDSMCMCLGYECGHSGPVRDFME